MKNNYIHICFVIDESGSMSGSENDVVNGFKKVIDEQKVVEEGSCSVSFYKFNSYVTKLYIGKDISEVKPLEAREITRTLWNRMRNFSNLSIEEQDESAHTYSPSGGTAMFDGIGQAIDEIGKWLSDMPEEERPEKNLIVIMTDGEENSSHRYSASKIKEMIKEQEEKYNWTFLYMGTDISTTEYADSIGIKNQAYTTKMDYASNYSAISKSAKAFRCAAVGDSVCSLDLCLENEMNSLNNVYQSKTGLNMKKNTK